MLEVSNLIMLSRKTNHIVKFIITWLAYLAVPFAFLMGMFASDSGSNDAMAIGWLIVVIPVIIVKLYPILLKLIEKNEKISIIYSVISTLLLTIGLIIFRDLIFKILVAYYHFITSLFSRFGMGS